MINNSIYTSYPVINQIQITDMFSFFQAYYEKGYEFSGETHNFWECLYVLNGAVRVSADERIYELKEGGLIFHKPLELHKFSVDGQEGATLIIFSFSAEGPLIDWFRNKVFSLTDIQRKIIRSLIEYTEERVYSLGEMNSETVSLISPVLNSYLQPFGLIPHYAQWVCSYLQQLFLSLAEGGAISNVSSAPDALTFRKAVSYLNAHLDSQPSVSDVAHYCSLSDASLKRLFDKYAGISVHKYFLTIKINAAIELLGDGESVSETANRLGFTSQSYFSKTFKRIVGLSPTEYVKRRG